MTNPTVSTEDPPSGIPTFDVAEFSDEKQLSEKTLVQIRDSNCGLMLRISPENRAQIPKVINRIRKIKKLDKS